MCVCDWQARGSIRQLHRSSLVASDQMFVHRDSEANNPDTPFEFTAENLKVIINDILDLASIESGKLRFEKIAFNIKDLIPSLLSTFAYQAQEKKINLQHIIDERLLEQTTLRGRNEILL